MHRLAFLVSLVAVIVGLVAVRVGPEALAQAGTPTAMVGHPIVGAWLADNDVNDPENAPALLLFHDDGTFAQANPDGSDGFGTWEATGPNTATLTALFHDEDDSGAFAGTVELHVAVEVAEAGDVLTGEFTLAFIAPDGTSADMGSGMAEAERIVVQPMGTPTP
jgi:hypothetical protein